MIYKRRKSRVEHPFGHIKRNLKADAFMWRGREGVQAETSLLATCYTIVRMITLCGGVPGLIQRLMMNAAMVWWWQATEPIASMTMGSIFFGLGVIYSCCPQIAFEMYRSNQLRHSLRNIEGCLFIRKFTILCVCYSNGVFKTMAPIKRPMSRRNTSPVTKTLLFALYNHNDSTWPCFRIRFFILFL